MPSAGIRLSGNIGVRQYLHKLFKETWEKNSKNPKEALRYSKLSIGWIPTRWSIGEWDCHFSFDEV